MVVFLEILLMFHISKCKSYKFVWRVCNAHAVPLMVLCSFLASDPFASLAFSAKHTHHTTHTHSTATLNLRLCRVFLLTHLQEFIYMIINSTYYKKNKLNFIYCMLSAAAYLLRFIFFYLRLSDALLCTSHCNFR